jgi:hypothetical protein
LGEKCIGMQIREQITNIDQGLSAILMEELYEIVFTLRNHEIKLNVEGVINLLV